MIFIMGGCFQGKEDFAKKLAGENFENQCGDGENDDLEQALKKTYLLNFHEFIRKGIKEDRDIDEFVRQVLEKNPEIITMAEVGCGIVPMERSERDYREAAGRAGQVIAGEADQVFRVQCGIAVRIK